jgi:hypothetical protein
MPLSKSITSTPSTGMFQTQTETFNVIQEDVSADYKLVTITNPRSTESQYVLVADAPQAGSFLQNTGKADGVDETVTITVEDLSPNTITRETRQRLEDGNVVSETSTLNS